MENALRAIIAYLTSVALGRESRTASAIPITDWEKAHAWAHKGRSVVLKLLGVKAPGDTFTLYLMDGSYGYRVDSVAAYGTERKLFIFDITTVLQNMKTPPSPTTNIFLSCKTVITYTSVSVELK